MIPSLRDFAAATLGIIGWQCGQVWGETLQPVKDSTDWIPLLIAFAAGVAIVACIWFLRHHPGAVAKAKEEGATLAAALHNLTQTHAEAVAKIPVAGIPVTPAFVPEVMGKNGQPGTFTITVHVDGQPATDMPAINAAIAAAYFS